MNTIFKRVLLQRETQLLNYLPQMLERNGYKNVIQTDDYVYAEGNIPVLLVAHLDTVHTTPLKDIYYDSIKSVAWSPQGIGGDDRCGVYSILKITEEYKPYVLFTTKEEVGGVGANVASRQLYSHLKESINFIIELDRHGSNDAVFYHCGNKSFQDYILGFGFETEIGSFSDISILSPAWDVASVNLSCGYYNEHSDAEYIKVNEMYEVIEKVKCILSQPNEIRYDYQKAEAYIYSYADFPNDGNSEGMTDSEWYRYLYAHNRRRKNDRLNQVRL